MSNTLENVTVTKAANIYYDGAVTSRTVLLASGEKITLGIMMPGDYTFGTGDKEIMEIQAGTLEILLPDSEAWETIVAPSVFEVPANTSFSLKVKTVTDYLCRYIAE